MWTIAYKTLIADRGKLITALVGVIFSVVLVNIQGGLFVGLLRKASLLIDQGEAEIWVGHREINNVDFAHNIPRRWVQRIRTIDGVYRAEPYMVGHGLVTLPDGGFEHVVVVGCEPSTMLGGATSILGGDPNCILQTDGIIVDVYDAHKIGSPRIGDIREIGGRRARVVGFSEGIVGFLVQPYIFTTIDRAEGFLHRTHEDASYFLVQIKPGTDSARVCAEIKRRIPDAEVYTRNQYAATTINYWLKRTGLGISFGASTGLGLIVGLVIVAQTLYASVLDRLSEFGALKAIGASELQIHSIVLTQALVLALVGTAFGISFVAIVQSTFSTPRAPITIPFYLYAGSCLLVTLICMASSLLPYLRVRQIDPAMVLQT